MYICIHQKDTSYRHRNLCNSINLYPDTQCIAFLPTFGEFFYGKLVNIQVTLNFWDIFFHYIDLDVSVFLFVYIHTLIRLMVQKSSVHQLIWRISHDLRGGFLERIGNSLDFWSINSLSTISISQVPQKYLCIFPCFFTGKGSKWQVHGVHVVRWMNAWEPRLFCGLQQKFGKTLQGTVRPKWMVKIMV